MSSIELKETLEIEFKSDKKKLSDEDIIDVVVAFVNTNGGDLYLGVEDNGEITGVHPSHRDATQLSAYISNKTVPPVSARVETLDFGDDILVVKVNVSKSRSIVASSSGKVLRRRLKPDGTPENVPLYPHEFASRLSDLSLLDFSAQPVPECTIADFDPIERERLRNIIRSYNGEQALLELTDEELDRALQLVANVNGTFLPTYTGMLLIGRANRLSTVMPTAGLSIQVLSGTAVKVNEDFHIPLLAAFEKISEYFNAHNTEEELEIGLFRVPVPEFDKRAFREALVNACCHRDYTMLGRVRVLIDDDGLQVTNPGGFIEGISIDNLLTAEPHGRNQALADAFKRIGLAERTGRGIDRIFEGSLRYGRPLPDYSASNTAMVKLFIARSISDMAFIRMISEEQNRIGRILPVNTLMVLSSLRKLHRATSKEIVEDTHIDESRIRAIIEYLTESGLVEASGSTKARTYILSSSVYRSDGNAIGYVRQSDIDKVRYPELILKLVKAQGSITRADVAELLHISLSQAYREIFKLCERGKLVSVGKGRGAKYVEPESVEN